MRNVALTVIFFASTSLLANQTVEAQLLRRPLQNRIVQPRAFNQVPPQMPASSFQNGSWYPYVIARRADREWIRQTPVELRPNRPMHFWGNSRRRMWR